MVVVSSRDFRANQSRYIRIAHRGEDVILKSRAGSVRLMPVNTFEDSEQEEDKMTVGNENDEFPGLDYSDPDLWKEIDDMPPLPEDKETYTLEELRKILHNDIKMIYEAKYAYEIKPKAIQKVRSFYGMSLPNTNIHIRTITC